MPLSLAYWLLILFWILSSAWMGYSTPAPGRLPLWGGSFLLLLLLLLIGLKIFGAPIRGG